MSNYQSLNHHHLFSKLSKYSRNGFTGRLNIKLEDTSWRIYFNTGSIIWASGGIHPVRRWLRQLKGCRCQMTIPNDMTKQELLSPSLESWDYFALSALMQDNHVTPEQVKYIVEGAISEVLFDIVQAFSQVSQEEVNRIQMLRKPGITPCDKQYLLPAWMWRTESAKQRIIVTWHSWLSAGLGDFSPNLGVVPVQQSLEAQNLNALAQYLLQIERKQKTLRDIAVDNQKNVLSILRTMKGYFNQKLIKFKPVPDLWEAELQQNQPASGGSQGQVTGPLFNVHQQQTQQTPSSASLSLTTPMSGWLNYSKEKSVSHAAQLQEGVKVNVMEALVAQEVERQLKSLPRQTIEYINKLDVITYALNRVPPLYAASKEGIAYQTQEAKRNHQKVIQKAVQQAITTVQRDPMRRSTRLSPKDETLEQI